MGQGHFLSSCPQQIASNNKHVHVCSGGMCSVAQMFRVQCSGFGV